MRADYVDACGVPATGEVAPCDPDLVETACLAHDLGHPPFGHIGEETLCEVFDHHARTNDNYRATVLTKSKSNPNPPDADHWTDIFGGFEGNAQSFRVLTYLSNHVSDRPHHGLHLTRASLDAVTKYPRFRTDARKMGSRKWGAYGGPFAGKHDAEMLALVRAGADVPSGQSAGRDAAQCFEAQLMDWCDDVAYAVHDIFDFYRSGQIPLDRLVAPSTRRGPRRRAAQGKGFPWNLSTEAISFLRTVVSELEDEKGNGITPAWESGQLEAAWMQLLTEISSAHLPLQPWSSTSSSKGATQRLANLLTGYFTDNVTWIPRGAEPTRHGGACEAPPMRYEAELRLDESTELAELKEAGVFLLKKLIWVFVINKPALATQQHGQARIVQGLVDMYYDAKGKMLPADREEEFEETEDLLRVVTDHVATMTEPDATALYLRLMGSKLGAFSDVV